MSINDEKPNNEQLTVSKHETEIDRLLEGKNEDSKEQQNTLLEEIRVFYAANDKCLIRKVEHRNILIVGRTRSGKSTIKKMLVDPTEPADEMSLYAGTRKPIFEAFVVESLNLVFNIIDTPGLFEHMKNRDEIRENEAILETIVECVNLEITKFHLICFAISITSGIQEDDIKALQLFKDRLGPELANYACLIITHCEMKNEKQRKALNDQLVEDPYFKPLVGYFKKGILFSGCINHDDYLYGNLSIVNQFKTTVQYREQLIELFRKETKPLEISKSCLTNLLKIQSEHEKKIIKLIAEKTVEAERLKAQNQVNDTQHRKKFDELEKELQDAEKEKIAEEKKAATEACAIS